MANAEYIPQEGEVSTEITEIQPSALSILNQSEHAAMVATANISSNRRKIDEFNKKLMAYATYSQPVAIGMFYSLPRAGKQIVGASVRFAEVVAPCWKNNSTGSRMIGSTDDTITAQGVFIDYEANMRNVKEIPRRITNSQGQKFNSDMILTTGKAALSIAYREAVLKGGVPMALWNPAYEQAKLTAVGSAVSHNARIDAAMEYLTKLGVSEWQICNAVGVTSPKELEIDHLVTLKTLCEEIKKGARTIEEVFGSPHDKEIEALFTQMGKNETEKRLLRQSYMGRAKELVEYLRERIAPKGQATAKAEPKATEKPAEQATEQAPKQAPKETLASIKQGLQESAEGKSVDRGSFATEEQEEEVKRGRGRPKKIDSAPEEKPDTQPETHAVQDENPEQQAAETGKFQF